MEKERIRATRSKDKDEYWGYWLICDCGYEYNTEEATFCGGCGKEMIESREVKHGHWEPSVIDKYNLYGFCSFGERKEQS